MRNRFAAMLLLVFPCGWVQDACAQPSSSQVVYSKHRHFRIPYNVGPGGQRLKQLQLFVSTDKGKTWQPSAIAPPDAAPQDRYFRFISENDGLYWFTVQTLDKQGKYYPASMESAKPTLKVIVDTLPPEVNLFALPSQNNQVGVTWQIREEHIDLLDAESIKLWFRPVGADVWIPRQINRVINQYYWQPNTSSVLEVRLQVTDRAGNRQEAFTKVSLSGAGAAPVAPKHNPNAGQLPNHNPPYKGAVPVNRRLVNSKKISLSYDIQDKGPSGVSAIELWFTQDGRNWNKYPLPKTYNDVLPNPLVFNVDGEGIYGFTLIAKNGVGLGAEPPQIGDEPQIWVEVDLTKPKVQLGSVIVHKGAEKGKLTISWQASDKNLSKLPIRLSYSEQLSGPWTPITIGTLENTGNYTWDMPQPMEPYQFYIRIEATDMAGNTGEDVTPELVKVDLSQPKVNILKVEPASGQ